MASVVTGAPTPSAKSVQAVMRIRPEIAASSYTGSRVSTESNSTIQSDRAGAIRSTTCGFATIP